MELLSLAGMWSCIFWNGLRVDRVNKGLLKKMKQAGCSTLNYGVESVNPVVLRGIKTGIT